MATDFTYIIWWWLVLFSLGFAFLPLTSRIFSGFVDRGYPFAKVIGILLLTYAFFLVGHTKLLPLTFPVLAFLLILLLASQIFILAFASSGETASSHGLNPTQNSAIMALNKPEKIIKETLTNIGRHWKLLLFEELLFFMALSFWSFIRGFAPEIRGLEKFMDFGFINSILTNKILPPLDMWLTQAPDYSGHFINYYYFGHLYSAVLTKLSGLDSAITYNLLIATIFAFAIALPFSIAINLLKQWISSAKTLIMAGILTAFLVALAGNLHTIYVFTTGYPNENPIPFWQILDGYNPSKYWYPNATRFIKNTIHEFPSYSFVVSDLHGHVLDIPLVLLTLSFLLSLITKSRTTSTKSQTNVKHQNQHTKQEDFRLSSLGFEIWNLVLLGLLTAVLYMTNAWDGIIYFVLSGMVLTYLNFKKTPNWSALNKAILHSIVIAFSFFIFALPFSFNFKPFVSGIGVVCPPEFLSNKTIGPFLFEEAATHCDRSPLWMLGLLWGFFAYNAAGFLVFIILPGLKKFKNWKLKIENLASTDIFVLLMIILSTLLLIFPEFFYAKDIYPAHYRANTMFKLGYQAFIMMQIASAYIFFRILFNRRMQQSAKELTKHQKKSKLYKPLIPYAINRLLHLARVIGQLGWVVGFFFGFYLVGIYPYFAINSYYGSLKVYKGLDGIAWMKNQYPNDYEAILWLRQKIKNSEITPRKSVILEAVGESYTDYARVSAYTGLPTVVGWPVHEWLWRGSYDEPGKRIPLVETMYTSTDFAQVKKLLDKYKVTYVFVGTLERQKYPKLVEDVFWNLGEVIFQSGKTRIYKIRE